MKKIILTSFITVFSLAVFSGKLTAQPFDKALVVSAIKMNPAILPVAIEKFHGDEGHAGPVDEELKLAKQHLKALKANLRTLKANFKATSSFKNMFNDTPETQWYFGADVIIASFVKEEIKTEVIYNKKGNWVHTLAFYPPAKTPQAITSIVNKDFPGIDIAISVLVTEGGKEFYIVNLRNDRLFKQVAISDGVSNLIAEFNLNR